MLAYLGRLEPSVAALLGISAIAGAALLIAMFRALSQGDRFEIESHWGGLGGGLGGWRVSKPLVFLLAVLAIIGMAALAARPPEQKQKELAQTGAASTKTENAGGEAGAVGDAP